MTDDETMCWRASWNGQDEGMTSSEYTGCHQQALGKDRRTLVVVLVELSCEASD